MLQLLIGTKMLFVALTALGL